jgi:hypothetical protein
MACVEILLRVEVSPPRGEVATDEGSVLIPSTAVADLHVAHLFLLE